MWMSVVKLFLPNKKKRSERRFGRNCFFIEIRLKIWVTLKSTTAKALGAQAQFNVRGAVGGTTSKIYPQFSRQVNYKLKKPYLHSISILQKYIDPY
jgi:hypothetical protein